MSVLWLQAITRVIDKLIYEYTGGRQGLRKCAHQLDRDNPIEMKDLKPSDIANLIINVNDNAVNSFIRNIREDI